MWPTKFPLLVSLTPSISAITYARRIILEIFVLPATNASKNYRVERNSGRGDGEDFLSMRSDDVTKPGRNAGDDFGHADFRYDVVSDEVIALQRDATVRWQSGQCAY